ncbi:MAG: cupredoxin domain-containing protein, partial [Candidatus Binatia bacterium]
SFPSGDGENDELLPRLRSGTRSGVSPGGYCFPLFGTRKPITLGTQRKVFGVDELPAREWGYGFHCLYHPWMRGTIFVNPPSE